MSKILTYIIATHHRQNFLDASPDTVLKCPFSSSNLAFCTRELFNLAGERPVPAQDSAIS
jgi:hypothetical protein